MKSSWLLFVRFSISEMLWWMVAVGLGVLPILYRQYLPAALRGPLDAAEDGLLDHRILAWSLTGSLLLGMVMPVMHRRPTSLLVAVPSFVVWLLLVWWLARIGI